VDRRKFVGTFLGGLFVAPFAAYAQQAGKVPHVGVLSPGSPPVGAVDAFRQGLLDLGHVEGRSVVIEWRFSEGQSDRLPGLARELVRHNVDVLVAINTPAALAAQRSTKTIPIVFARCGDPVRTGLVVSFGRPGGNLTGLSSMIPDMSVKRLALLKEALPNLTRVAILWDMGNAASVLSTEVLARSS